MLFDMFSKLEKISSEMYKKMIPNTTLLPMMLKMLSKNMKMVRHII